MDKLKLSILTRKVVQYLKKSRKPKSSIDIANGIKLPLNKKRRIYDVIDVLSTLNLIKIHRKGNEKLVEWASNKEESPSKIEKEEKTLLEGNKNYCFINLDLVFSSSDFKTLKNPTWQDMIIRDIKRSVKGVMDIIINDVKLSEPELVLKPKENYV